jgi:hypothetical protein
LARASSVGHVGASDEHDRDQHHRTQRFGNRARNWEKPRLPAPDHACRTGFFRESGLVGRVSA